MPLFNPISSFALPGIRPVHPGGARWLSRPVVGGDVFFSGISDADKAKFQRQQQQAEAQWAALPLVLQFAFPPRDNRIRPNTMAEIQQAIQGVPALNPAVMETLRADPEGMFARLINGSNRADAAACRQLIRERIQALAPETGLSVETVASALQFVQSLGKDGAVVARVLPDYKRFYEYALKNHQAYGINQKRYSREAVSQLVQGKALIILKAMILSGYVTVTNKFDQKETKFERFLDKTIPKILANPEATRLLYEFFHPVKKTVIPSSQYVKIVDAAPALLGAQGLQILKTSLATMAQQDRVNLDLLKEGLVTEFARAAGMPESEIRGFSPAQFDLWDSRYLATLLAALDEVKQSDPSYHPPDLQGLKDLFKATMRGTYWNYLFDPQTSVGRANIQTRQDFQQAGLNFDTWMHFKPEKPVEFRMADGTPHSVMLWERQPGIDLFQGSIGVSCSALDCVKGQSVIEALQGTAFQFVNILNENTGEPVGYARCYFARNTRSRKPILVVDAIQYADKYKVVENDRQLVKGVAQFMQAYGKAVNNGQDVPVYISSHAHSLSACSLDRKDYESLTFRLIGKTHNNGFYINTVDDVSWTTDLDQNFAVRLVKVGDSILKPR